MLYINVPIYFNKQIVFFQLTGTPVKVSKRMQFNMFIGPVERVTLMRNIKTALHPIFWIEEVSRIFLNNPNALKNNFEPFKRFSPIIKFCVYFLKWSAKNTENFDNFSNSKVKSSLKCGLFQEKQNSGPCHQNGKIKNNSILQLLWDYLYTGASQWPMR